MKRNALFVFRGRLVSTATQDSHVISRLKRVALVSCCNRELPVIRAQPKVCL